MIYRVHHNKDNPYFMLNRAAVNDEQLSFKAVGILTYLLSKPDTWTIQEEDLIKRHTDGVTAVRSGLKELQTQGYLVKVCIRDPDTQQITAWETHIFETPSLHKTHILGNLESGSPRIWETPPLVSNEVLVSIHPNDQRSAEAETEKQNTKEVSQLLQKVGVGLTPYILDQYSELITECGLPATLAGIQASADNNKQHHLRYVTSCIRNIAAGNQRITPSPSPVTDPYANVEAIDIFGDHHAN